MESASSNPLSPAELDALMHSIEVSRDAGHSEGDAVDVTGGSMGPSGEGSDQAVVDVVDETEPDSRVAEEDSESDGCESDDGDRWADILPGHVYDLLRGVIGSDDTDGVVEVCKSVLNYTAGGVSVQALMEYLDEFPNRHQGVRVARTVAEDMGRFVRGTFG